MQGFWVACSKSKSNVASLKIAWMNNSRFPWLWFIFIVKYRQRSTWKLKWKGGGGKINARSRPLG